MPSKPEARQAILNLVVAHYPRATWTAVQRGTAWAYQEAWASTPDRIGDDDNVVSLDRIRRF